MSTVPSALPNRPLRGGLLHALMRRLRFPLRGAAKTPVAATMRIGIEGLPAGVNQMPRRVPVSLVAADDSSTALWLPALLEDALATGPVGLVAPSAEWADRLLLCPALRGAYRNGQLLLWVFSPGLHEQVKRHGLKPLMNELVRTGLQSQHALCIGDAQPLLSGLSVAQLARLSHQLGALCRARARPVVLGFFERPPLDVLLPTLRHLCPLSMHIATLRTDADRWSLGLERWDSAAGAVFQTAFGLVRDTSSGRLTTDGTRTHQTASELIEAVDQSDVIVTRAAIGPQRGVPSRWRVVEHLADIEGAVASSVAATVILDAGRAGDFDALARLVHHLRLSRPPTLKIVVRENQDKLRLNSEQALMQLGASAVVYKEVGFSRLLQVLEGIQAQRHTRQVESDYGQAVDGFLAPNARGYQPPARFHALVCDILSRTQRIGLSHSLVQLNLRGQIPPLDALRACRISHHGDLLTADHQAVYVFLFACHTHDVELTLNRLFALPLTELFASEVIDCSDTSTRAMTEHLQVLLRRGLPDHSALLASPPHSPQSSALAPAAMDTNMDIDVNGMPGAVSEPARPPTPVGSAEPLRPPLPHSPVGPRMRPRPIARRALPPTQTPAVGRTP